MKGYIPINENEFPKKNNSTFFISKCLVQYNGNKVIKLPFQVDKQIKEVYNETPNFNITRKCMSPIF